MKTKLRSKQADNRKWDFPKKYFSCTFSRNVESAAAAVKYVSIIWQYSIDNAFTEMK